MKSSIDVLNAIGARFAMEGKPASDYRVAQLLESNPQRISAIRNGRLYLSKALAVRAAELLDVEPGPLVAIAAAERETDQRVKASLLKMAQAALTAAVLIWGALPAQAAQAAGATVANVYYVKRRAGRMITRIAMSWARHLAPVPGFWLHPAPAPCYVRGTAA